MTKILVDKAVIEQALEALQELHPGTLGMHMFDLRNNAIDKVRAALEQPQIEQQPVVWMTEDGRIATDATKQRGMASTSRPNFNIPLYLHPQPPRQPLTDEQIGEIVALKEQRDELLEALKFYLSAWDGGEVSWFQHCYKVERKARKAIAKATGETK